jgi:flagellin-like hook-associated protein FlgL
MMNSCSELTSKEIDNILSTVNRIARNTQFGAKTLLDGSKGATGVVSWNQPWSL